MSLLVDVLNLYTKTKIKHIFHSKIIQFSLLLKQLLQLSLLGNELIVVKRGSMTLKNRVY